MYVRRDGPTTYVKLVDDTQKDMVCIVTLTSENHFDINYQVVKLVESNYERRGYLKYIFTVLIHDYDYVIMSDEIHTMPGSMDFWKKMKTWGDQVNVLNISTGQKRKYTQQEDQEIWGISDEYFIDGQINGSEIDHLYQRRLMHQNLYEFIKKNQDILRDRNSIRLTVHK